MIEKHEFGGNWTEEKLKMVEKYLKAYVVIMNNHNFRIDKKPGFDGTLALGLTLDLPIEQKTIEDNTVSVIYL